VEAELRRVTEGFGPMAVAPDGKKIVFTYWGELWASGLEGGEAIRVTKSVDLDDDPRWSPDSNSLAFTSTGDGESKVLVHDFLKSETRTIATGRRAAWSPDGKRLAYTREDELFNGETSLGVKTRSFAWSPDGEWIAALVRDERGFLNAQVIKADGTSRQQVSWLPNIGGDRIQWFPDAKSILFETAQRTEPIRVAVVDLAPREPEYRESRFRELFTKAPAAAKPSVQVISLGLRERLRILPFEMPATETTLSRDGKTLAFQSGPALFVAPLAGQPRAIGSGGPKTDLHWDTTGKTIFYRQQGRFYSVAIDNPQPKQIAASISVEASFEETKRALFQQAWMLIRDRFYDPAFHGVDWNGAVKRVFGEVIGEARTLDETRRLLNLMVGELNASHLGARAPGTAQPLVGYLGVDWDVNAYEREGTLRAGSVVPNGPAALAGLMKGDVVTHCNGAPLQGGTVLEKLLQQQIGREVVLRRQGKPDVRIKPVSNQAETGLRYAEWVAQRRAYVDKWSAGRLGYVHIPDMGSESLLKLQYDLDAENQAKDGVVVDIRNNRGGFVNGYALDILSRRNYINLQPRGQPVATGRAQLGQRAFGKPTVLLVNQHTLSDGEDFTEGYRTLGLGKVVGEPTAGWIIYTSDVPLLDGTIFRLPGTKVTTLAGENMELKPRAVDIRVDRPAGESYRDSDVQLATAVKTLLTQLRP